MLIKIMQKILFYYLLIFTVFIGFYFIYGFSITQGNALVYPLDDVYIHLAIAKNFGEQGFWSINPGDFDSGSSSILYTLILSLLIKLFGDNLYYPMIINVLAGYGTVFWVYRFFKDFFSEKLLKIGMFISVLSMLYVMVLLGMEQTIHMMLSVIALYYIKQNEQSGYAAKDYLKLILVILLLGMVRFESMFFVTALTAILIINKRIKEGIGVLLIGFLPIVVFGLISIQCGGYFFPNSVLIKGNYPDGNILMSIWMIFKKGILMNVSFYKLFLFPFICIALYLFDNYKNKGLLAIVKNEVFIWLVVSVALMQSLFGLIKIRYENYIMIMLYVVVISISGKYLKIPKKITLKQSRIQQLFFGSFVCFVAVGVYLVFYSHFALRVASKNIQEQQLEMSRFLHDYYKGQKVIANDIGAISYFSEVDLLDIVGLGSTDVTHFFVDNKGLEESEFNNKFHKFLEDYAKENQYKVAIIYPGWFPNDPPKDWIAVASWTIFENRGTARDTVVLYAINKQEADKLLENIKHFQLNKNVKQQLLYK